MQEYMMTILYGFDEQGWVTSRTAVDHQSQGQMEYFFQKRQMTMLINVWYGEIAFWNSK